MSLRSILGKHIEIGKYGCKKCKNYESEYYSCRLEECIHGEKNVYIPSKSLKNLAVNSRKKKHKCKGCKWTTFTGTKYFCMLPRCIPTLGNFNKKVNEDGKQENLQQNAKELL